MLTKIQNPRRNYFSRILLIPVMAVVTLAFTVRTKEQQITYTGNKKITVVIDAGHGGNDAGAKGENILEKDLALALARQVKAINTNPNINIVLTRDNDNTISLKDRVAVSAESKADLFISLHVNATSDQTAASNTFSGIEVVVPKDSVHYQAKSVLLGSALVQELSSVYTTLPYLLQRQLGIMVLNKNACPSVLIECGYITNEKDRSFFQQAANQKLVAQKIIKGIEAFVQVKETSVLPVKTMTEAKNDKGTSHIDVIKRENAKRSKKIEDAKPSDIKTYKEATYTGDVNGWKQFLFQAIGAPKEGC